MLTANNNLFYSNEEPVIIEDTSVQKTSSFLDNLKITVVSGGGIAAVEIPRFVRELRRHGANTQIFMTENCLKFVGIDSMRWASQNEVITNPSGLSEHICTSDIVIVAPATADLISKIKNGICSDAATTLVQSALGFKKTIIFCQTMHDSLANSPIIIENKNYLKKLPNVFFIEPRKEEGKQKIPSADVLAMNICHITNKQRNKEHKHILITYGGTRVMLDPVRCITNLSTGALGVEVAKVFYGMGYNLTILAANTNCHLPWYDNIQLYHLPDYNDMFKFAEQINPEQFDGLIHLVAASDFTPDHIESNKINSDTKELKITLSKTKKLLSHTMLKDIEYKAAAKLTAGNNKETELNQAINLLNENKLNAVFWNTAHAAWGKQNNHNGIFFNKRVNLIHEEQVNDKKQIALCYLNAFKNWRK